MMASCMVGPTRRISLRAVPFVVRLDASKTTRSLVVELVVEFWNTVMWNVSSDLLWFSIWHYLYHMLEIYIFLHQAFIFSCYLIIYQPFPISTQKPSISGAKVLHQCSGNCWNWQTNNKFIRDLRSPCCLYKVFLIIWFIKLYPNKVVIKKWAQN